MECSCRNTVSSSRLAALAVLEGRGRENSFSQLPLGGVQGAGLFQLGCQGSLRNTHSLQLSNITDYAQNTTPTTR